MNTRLPDLKTRFVSRWPERRSGHAPSVGTYVVTGVDVPTQRVELTRADLYPKRPRWVAMRTLRKYYVEVTHSDAAA